MKLAIDAATGAAEPTAWTHVQLGKLYFNHGRDRRRRARVPLRARGSSRTTPTASTRSPQAQAARGHATRRRSRSSGRPSTLIPLPQYVAALGDLYRVTGHPRARAPAVRADRRDREAAARERRPHRPRDRALPGRPRDPRCSTRSTAPASAAPSGRRSTATTCSAGRSRGTASAPRRSRYSQHGAPPRHAGRAQVLPPRDDRALPRPRRRGAHVVPARARAQPALLAPLGAGREEVRVDEAPRRPRRRRRRSRCSRRSRRRRTRSATSRSTASAASRSRATASTCVYVLDLAEIPTFQAKQSGGIDARRLRRSGSPPSAHLTRRRPPRPARPARRTQLAFPPGRRRAATRRGSRCSSAGRGSPGRAGSPTATRTTPAGSAGGDRRRRGTRHEPSSAPSSATAARVPEGPALRARSHVTSLGADARPEPSRASAADADPRRARCEAPDRVADSGFAKLIVHDRPERRLRPRSRC